MSGRGECVDNMPIQTFFGQMKDKINFKVIKNYDQLQYVIYR